jgi:hypothetical protein
MLTVAVRAPLAAGVKVTLIVQVALAASVLGLMGQVSVSPKSLAFAPLTAMLLNMSAAVPLLVSMIARVALVVPTFWFPKLTLVGLRVTAGAEITPLPVSATLCGLPLALSLTLTVAVRGPVADGVKVTLIAQFALAASVLGLSGHVDDSAKSVALVPASVMLLIVSGAVPLFARVIVCVALVVPTF